MFTPNRHCLAPHCVGGVRAGALVPWCPAGQCQRWLGKIPVTGEGENHRKISEIC